MFFLQDEVRSQDTIFAIGGVTGSLKGRELAWNFVKNKWSELHGRYKGGFLLSRLIKVSLKWKNHQSTNMAHPLFISPTLPLESCAPHTLTSSHTSNNPPPLVLRNATLNEILQ